MTTNSCFAEGKEQFCWLKIIAVQILSNCFIHWQICFLCKLHHPLVLSLLSYVLKLFVNCYKKHVVILFCRARYAHRSDLRNMSSFLEPQYAPLTKNRDEYLGILPNIYNPGWPLLVTLHPYQIMRMYDILHWSKEECDQMMSATEGEDEDRDLYGGSTNPIPPDQ